MTTSSSHILALFLDGIGLGADDPRVNPFAVADLPTLHSLSNGKRWLANTDAVAGRQYGLCANRSAAWAFPAVRKAAPAKPACSRA